ncbi:hypothetical protein MTO96_047990 [Rhipicephalus appendiculatus]
MLRLRPPDATKDASKEPDKKDGEKKEGPTDMVDKDYVIFHFPGVEQKDGTSAGCETLKIPRDAAIELVSKVRPAVARLVEQCHCNDAPPEPEDVEPMVPCVDCMAELKTEARRLSTKAFVQTAAPPLPDKIKQQMSFIKISCGKCGAEQVMDPAQTAAVKAPAAAAAKGAAAAPAHAGASTSGAGHCTGPAFMNVVAVDPGSNTHFQFTCHCLEQFGLAHKGGGGGSPLPPIPHMPDCCYSLGGGPHPPAGRASSSRDHHNDHVRDRLIREECIMKERIEEDDYGSPGRRVYEEFEERLTYGNGGGGRSRSSRDFDGGGRRSRRGRGRHEEDLSDLSEGDDDGRYSVRRTSSGNVAIIGDDNYKVRVEVGGRRSEGRRRGYR